MKSEKTEKSFCTIYSLVQVSSTTCYYLKNSIYIHIYIYIQKKYILCNKCEKMKIATQNRN